LKLAHGQQKAVEGSGLGTRAPLAVRAELVDWLVIG
jgi:hypothetical protein